MNETFKAMTFTIPELEGIGAKNIEEHLKLYKGYVTNSNSIIELIKKYSADTENYGYVLGELRRRLSFEFNGMRNHEYYFTQFEGGSHAPTVESQLYKKIESTWGSFEEYTKAHIQMATTTRGIGWAMLSYDKKSDTLLLHWIDEQHLGQLQETAPIIALDMWEHAYVYDYPTSEKKKYVEAFFENINWKVIEARLEK
jgi:Fe-Mn family superoxide dismutase